MSWQKPPKNIETASLTEIARKAGWPIRTLERWASLGKIAPDEHTGKYSTDAIWEAEGRALSDNTMDRAEKASVASRKEAEELRKLQIENERRLVDLERKKESLISRDSVEEAFAEIRNFVRDRLPSIVDSFPPELRDEVRRPLESFCHDLDMKVRQLPLMRPK